MLLDIRAALRAFLLGDAAIDVRVGGERIFPSVVPQGERRLSLVYHRVSSIGDHHMQGPSGLMVVRMQLTAWARVQDDAEDLCDRVQWRLDGYRGPMRYREDKVVMVRGAFLASDNPPLHDQAMGLFGIGRDYMIHYAQR